MLQNNNTMLAFYLKLLAIMMVILGALLIFLAFAGLENAMSSGIASILGSIGVIWMAYVVDYLAEIAENTRKKEPADAKTVPRKMVTGSKKGDFYSLD